MGNTASDYLTSIVPSSVYGSDTDKNKNIIISLCAFFLLGLLTFILSFFITNMWIFCLLVTMTSLSLLISGIVIVMAHPNPNPNPT